MVTTPDKEEGKVKNFCKPHFNVAVFFWTTLKKRKFGMMITTPDKEEGKVACAMSRGR